VKSIREVYGEPVKIHPPKAIRIAFYVLWAVGMVSVLALGTLETHYEFTYPTHPVPAQGLETPFNIQGRVVYLTKRQADTVRLLDDQLMSSVFLAIVMGAWWHRHEIMTHLPGRSIKGRQPPS